VIHRAGEIGIGERDPTMRLLAQDVAWRRLAIDPKEEAGLRIHVGVAPAVEDERTRGSGDPDAPHYCSLSQPASPARCRGTLRRLLALAGDDDGGRRANENRGPAMRPEEGCRGSDRAGVPTVRDPVGGNRALVSLRRGEGADREG
jgi:hypothetical protein